jgi:hypothetical protein
MAALHKAISDGSWHIVNPDLPLGRSDIHQARLRGVISIHTACQDNTTLCVYIRDKQRNLFPSKWPIHVHYEQNTCIVERVRQISRRPKLWQDCCLHIHVLYLLLC